MKKILLTILVFLAAGALGAWLFCMSKFQTPFAATIPVKPSVKVEAGPTSPTMAVSSVQKKPLLATVDLPKPDPARADFDKSLGTLISPTTRFAEKQPIWEKLRDSGQLDQAIAELEKATASDPTSPDLFVALGNAYMVKSGTVQDITQVGALGMKIDQALSAALKLDPTNWEAQYDVARSLSFYPAFMNKGPDVVKTYLHLIQQQEQEPPQPEFASTYVLLGEQYQKQGNSDTATQIWQRGAQLFPNNDALQQKISNNAAQP